MQISISFKRNEVYECGASLLTVLACPEAIDTARSAELFRSLCGSALWDRNLERPEDCAPIPVNPRYAFLEPALMDRDVGYVGKRFGERMVAARMAIPFFQEALGLLKLLPEGVKRLSLNQMAEFVSEDAGQAEASNVKRRIWSKSRPVIHLAAAAAVIGQRLARNGEQVVMERFLTNRAHIEEVVLLAQALEGVAAKDPRFPVKAALLIQFRLS